MQTKAVVIENYGDSSKFEDQIVDIPELKPKQLLIKVSGS